MTAAGDEVVIVPYLRWGEREDGPAPDGEILGVPHQGTHAELIAVPTANLRPRPARLSWEESAALPLAGLTAWRALVTRGGVARGARVLVTGAGGGAATFLVQIAHALGAEVVVTSSAQWKIDRALELGAAAGVLYTDPEWPEQVGEIDIAVDSAGGPAWEGIFRCLRIGGTLVSFGDTMRETADDRDLVAVLRPVEHPRHDDGQPPRVRRAARPRRAGGLAAGGRLGAPARGRRPGTRSDGPGRPVRQGRPARAMSAVHLTQIALSYGADDVLRDVSAILRPRDRVALVGRNGAGKTTLLRVLAGELVPDTGTLSMPAGMTVALHDQRPPLARGVTLGAYVGEGVAEASGLEGRLRELERRMAEGDAEPETLQAYDRAQTAFERAGGYGWRARLESIARGLGFTPDDLDRQLDTFSGGELTRASLTRALAGGPDVLLLDEPTNHLDVDSIEWLEEYLDDLDATVVFVSHDRWFLESVATSVLELERGKGRLTKGSYSHWRREKAERLAQQADLYERQQEELAHLQRFVDRFRYGTKSRQAQSKLKAMARIERVDRPTQSRVLKFGFPQPRRSGRVVLEVSGLDVVGRRPDAGQRRRLRHRARASGSR